jgi:hypothetical protein
VVVFAGPGCFGRGTPTRRTLELPSSRIAADADTWLGPGEEAPVEELDGVGSPVGEVVGVGLVAGEVDGDGVGVAVALGVALGVGVGVWLEFDLGLQLGAADDRAEPVAVGVLPECDEGTADAPDFGSLLPTEPGPGPLFADGAMTCGRAVSAQ